MIFDALDDMEERSQVVFQFSKYHGLIDLRKWDKVIKNCCKNGNEFECDFFNYPNDGEF